MKRFSELSEREILSIAIASEEEDNRVYLMFAEDLRERYPATAQTFAKMAEVEAGHRDKLTALYNERFGPNLVPIRRSDVKSFLWRQPVWLTRNLPLNVIRKESEAREAELERFYAMAAERARILPSRLCSAISPARSRSMKRSRRISKENSREARPAPRRPRTAASGSSLNMSSPASSASWMDPCRRWRRCSPRLLRPTITGRPFSSASPPRSGPASAWASPRRSPTMAR